MLENIKRKTRRMLKTVVGITMSASIISSNLFKGKYITSYMQIFIYLAIYYHLISKNTGRCSFGTENVIGAFRF